MFNFRYQGGITSRQNDPRNHAADRATDGEIERTHNSNLISVFIPVIYCLLLPQCVMSHFTSRIFREQ